MMDFEVLECTGNGFGARCQDSARLNSMLSITQSVWIIGWALTSATFSVRGRISHS